MNNKLCKRVFLNKFFFLKIIEYCSLKGKKDIFIKFYIL